MSGWSPMTDAPRDRPVLLCDAEYGVQRAVFLGEHDMGGYVVRDTWWAAGAHIRGAVLVRLEQPLGWMEMPEEITRPVVAAGPSRRFDLREFWKMLGIGALVALATLALVICGVMAPLVTIGVIAADLFVALGVAAGLGVLKLP